MKSGYDCLSVKIMTFSNKEDVLIDEKKIQIDEREFRFTDIRYLTHVGGNKHKLIF